MKKFVSILTVVAMVAALSTSAFAANSPVSPLEPGQIVEHDPGDFNVPDPDAEGPAAEIPPATTGGGGETPSTPPAETPSTPSTPAATTGGSNETPAAGSSDGAASTESPTAKLDDYAKDSLAYKLISMLLDTTKTVSMEEIAEALGVELPFDKCTIASNPLAMKDAKGVKIKETEDGTEVIVGQNQVTENKDPENLFAVVVPAEGGEPEVCEITFDDPTTKNLKFKTKIKGGVFFIGMKAE